MQSYFLNKLRHNFKQTSSLGLTAAALDWWTMPWIAGLLLIGETITNGSLGPITLYG